MLELIFFCSVCFIVFLIGKLLSYLSEINKKEKDIYKNAYKNKFKNIEDYE